MKGPRRRRRKLTQRYGGGGNLNTAIDAINEPQHGSNLEAVEEHGEQWVTCRRCGRQWNVRGNDADIVTDGDGYCDDNPEDIAALVRY
jgi:hypothetical protein